MTEKEKRISIRIDNEQSELLEAAAKQIGLTLSSYVRMAALEKANRELLTGNK